jgi:hypothetical protein
MDRLIKKPIFIIFTTLSIALLAASPISPATAQSTVFTATPNAANGGDTGVTYRAFIVPSINSLGQVRVSIQASSFGGLAASRVSIAKSNSVPNTGVAANFVATATPVELKYSGSSGFSVASSVVATSDWTNFSWTTSDGLLVSIFWGTPENAMQTTGLTAQDQTAYFSTDITLTSNGTGSFISAASAGLVEALIKIETQSGGGGASTGWLPLAR